MKILSKWLELENIILSEASQVQKDMHGMYSLIILDKKKKKEKGQNIQDTVHRNKCIIIYGMDTDGRKRAKVHKKFI